MDHQEGCNRDGRINGDRPRHCGSVCQMRGPHVVIADVAGAADGGGRNGSRDGRQVPLA